MTTVRRRFRNSRGNAMSEFGPALIILLIFFFFPLMDLLSVCLSFALVMVLNYNQLHEASLIPFAQAMDPNGSVCKTIPDQWLSGMGHFVKISGFPQTSISYRNGLVDANNITEKIVAVRTTVVCTPFLPIPLPVFNVPGLNGPMTLSTASERSMENPDYGQ